VSSLTKKKSERTEMEEELFVQAARERLTPRLSFICETYDSWPVLETFKFYRDGQRMGFMDIAAMEEDEFSNPSAAGAIKALAMATDPSIGAVCARVSPATAHAKQRTVAGPSDGIKLKVKQSIFDVASPSTSTVKGAKEAEGDARERAVSSALSWLDDAQRECIMPGYGQLPPTVRRKLIHDSVAKMGSVQAIAQCAKVLHKLDQWMRMRVARIHRFKVDQAHVLWFLYDHAIAEDGDHYHVSEYLRSGMVFAKLHFRMEIHVQGDVVTSFTKRVGHTPVPAVSASVRLVFEMLRAANDPRRSQCERYYCAAFAVKALAALRGIDAQRSSLRATRDNYFVARAYDSKKKRAMDWVCPNHFAGYDIVGNLVGAWRGRDYLFMTMKGRKGCSLAEAAGFGDTVASAAVLLRLFRGLAESIGMPPELAKLMRRHSWRHFGANVARVAEFSAEDRSGVGRWGNIEDMPMRYAQEVEEVAMMAIVLKIERAVVRALERMPLAKWPWVAGWENLSPQVELRPSQVVPPGCCPEAEDRESDDEDSDVDEDDGSQVGPACAGGTGGEEVLAVWDRLQTAKEHARELVHGWAIEFVLRKSQGGSKGDCYATRAGCRRIRSRSALIVALGLEVGDGRAAQAAEAELEDAVERAVPPSGSGAAASAPHSEGAIPCAAGDQADALGAASAVTNDGREVPGGPSGSVAEALLPEHPGDCSMAKRPRRRECLEGWKDGDTAMSPPKGTRRRP